MSAGSGPVPSLRRYAGGPLFPVVLASLVLLATLVAFVRLPG